MDITYSFFFEAVICLISKLFILYGAAAWFCLTPQRVESSYFRLYEVSSGNGQSSDRWGPREWGREGDKNGVEHQCKRGMKTGQEWVARQKYVKLRKQRRETIIESWEWRLRQIKVVSFASACRMVAMSRSPLPPHLYDVGTSPWLRLFSHFKMFFFCERWIKHTLFKLRIWTWVLWTHQKEVVMLQKNTTNIRSTAFCVGHLSSV